MADESPPDDDVAPRVFERWALVGCFALAVVAVAAFVVHHQRRRLQVGGPDAADPAADRTLRVEIGGRASDTPPEPSDRRQEATTTPPEQAAAKPPNPQGEVDDATVAPPPETRPPAPVRSAPSRDRTVVVRPGETLGAIAQRELGTSRRANEIARLNGLQSADDIRAGQTLRLPAE